MEPITSPMTNRQISFIWALIGTFLFSIFYASGKLIPGNPPIFQLLFLRYVGGLITIAAITLYHTDKKLIYKSRWPLQHFARAFCGSTGAFCFIYAATISPLADVTALGLTDGVFTMLLSIIFLKEAVGRLQWLGALACAGGAFYIAYFGTEGLIFNSLSPGLLIALVGSVMISIESILIKVLVMKDNPAVVLLYVNFFALLIMAIPAYLTWGPISSWSILMCLGLGPIAISAQFCWAKAYSLEKVSIVTPINYTWIIFSAIISLFLFNQTISIHTIIGSALICCGGYVLSKNDTKQ